MRVTVIPSDKTIVIDSKPIKLESWDFSDENIHAIQWYHDYGYIEYTHLDIESPRPDNKKIVDESLITKYVDAYFSEVPKIQSKKIKEEEEERLRKQKEELELKKYEQEREELRLQVQEQIEINKKIRQEKLEVEQKKQEEILKIEEEKRIAKLELRQKEIEKQELLFEEEIHNREKYWKEYFEKENEKLMEYQKKVSEQMELSEKELQNKVKIIEKERDLELERLNNEKFITRKGQELNQIEYQNRLESLKSEEERIKVLNEEIDLKRKQNEKELDLSIQRLEEIQKEVQLERKLSSDYIQNAIEKYEKEKENLENEKRLFEEEIKDRELQTQIQIDRAKKTLENIRLDISIAKKEREEIESNLEEKVRDIEYRTIEDIRDDMKKHTLSELEERELRELARIEANNRLQEITNNFDNANILKFLAAASAEDIENIDIPVQRAIELLSIVGKVKELSDKYQVSIAEAVKHVTEEGYFVDGDDYVEVV
jgi:hypothetical protein